MYINNRNNSGNRSNFRGQRQFTPRIKINHFIVAQEVRVIVDETNEQLGVLSLSDALREANSRGLDLVEIAPDANPPVCKIVDYGKYKYQEQKRKDAIKSKSKQIQIKEIKLRPVISEHDFQRKVSDARRFIQDGNKVKFFVQFRGREITRQEVGMQLLTKAASLLEDIAIVEAHPKIDGKNAVMVIAQSNKMHSSKNS